MAGTEKLRPGTPLPDCTSIRRHRDRNGIAGWSRRTPGLGDHECTCQEIQYGNNRKQCPFFAIYAKPQNQEATTTLLAGPLYPQEYLHYEGRPVNHHGLPRFAQASFDAAYPFGQVHLSDKDLPVKVTIKGFNPLIPGDAEASGLPVAVLSYEVTNTTSQPMEIAICGSMRNFIGKDGSKFRTDWKGDYIPTGVKTIKTNTLKTKE